MRRTVQLICIALLAGMVATAAFAQATSATIRGKVTNERGSALANAEINAVSTSSGFVRSVKADANGSFNLAGLTPGEYNIVVAAPAYEARSETVRVLLGQNLEMNFVLSPTAVVNESITVVGNQLVETKTPEIATNITQQQMDNLPQDDRNFLNFAGLAPSIRLSADPQRKTFAGDAQDPERTNIFIDGVSTKNDVLQGGTSGQDASRGNPFPQSAVQEFRVISQNYSAQYDHASSAIITAVTKSGGNQFTGQAFAYFQPKGWISPTNVPTYYPTVTTNSAYHRWQPGISIGGPIIKDKMNFFATYEGDDEHAANAVVPNPSFPQLASQFQQFAGSFPAPFRQTLGFGKLSWQMASNQLVDISANYRREHEIRDFGNQDSFQAGTDLRNWVYGATLRHQWNNSNALNEASVSLQKYGWNPTPLNPNLVGKRYFGPGFATVIRVGGNSTTQDFDQRRLELRDNYNFAPMTMHGTHNFQAGGNIDFMHYRVNKSLTGNPEFKFLPDANNQYGNIPFEADFGIGNPILAISNNEYGIYGQDNWQVNQHLQLNLGLRWDYETHMLDQNYVTPSFIVAGLKGKSFTFDNRTITIPDEYFSSGSERKPFKNEYQPRFGFSYDIFGNSKSVVFGGWGKYYDRLFLNSTLDERFRLQFPVYRFEFSPDGAPGTVKWDPSYFTIAGLQQLIAQGAAHPEVYLLSNNTKPPYATQYNVGYRQAFGEWLGSASYNAVRGKRGITYVSASGTCCAAFVPGFGNIIINDPVGKSFWYDAETFTLDRPYTSTGPLHWSARFLYTHAKSLQNGNDLFSLDLPSASAYARHPVAGSEPNHFVASGIIGLPWDIRFSTTLTYGTGGAQPVFDFSQGFEFVNRLKTGVLDRAVYPPGHYKNADFALQKDFKAFGRTTVTGIVQVFNAFNNTNYAPGSLTNFLGPGGDPASLGQPSTVITLARREQVGVKVSF